MPKKILIADDSLFMRKVLKDILSKKSEYEIVEANSGANTEQQFKKEKPDLVLLDIIMPDGEEEGIRVLIIKPFDEKLVVNTVKKYLSE